MTATPSTSRLLRRLSARLADELDQPKIVPLDYEGAPLRLYVTSRRELSLRIRSCAKEPHTIAWIERDVGPGDVFYDVGANVGAYSLVAAARMERTGTVVAFEPGYASYARLCDNIVLNELEDVVVPIALALADETGIGRFNYKHLYPGFESHAVEAAAPRHVPSSREPVFRQRALTVRLDDLVGSFGLPAPNHLKIDVDGAELAVLRGADATLARSEVRSALVEIHREVADEVVARLRGHGFALDERHGAHGSWYGLFRR